jgi:7,8-dihydropterin-6-yl-methyl-4-(beta-D-ribofuranosyl)aminobenzene 5'-phosphate synthase
MSRSIQERPGPMRAGLNSRFLFLLAVVIVLQLPPVTAGEEADVTPMIRVVFDNVVIDEGLQSAWGFAAVIETPDTNILYDTGRDGRILISNMRHMELAPDMIDLIFLSHAHGDHAGGLDAVLTEKPELPIYLSSSTLGVIRHRLPPGTRIIETSAPTQITTNIHSSGEMGSAPAEQALVIETVEGLVVVTGCAHPGITLIAEKAKAQYNSEIYMLAGGFHLFRAKENIVRDVIARLRALGVRKVAPSHCTGKRAAELFRDAWGEDFIESGLGAVIPLPPLAGKQ